jgi:hypothetical protein
MSHNAYFDEEREKSKLFTYLKGTPINILLDKQL